MSEDRNRDEEVSEKQARVVAAFDTITAAAYYPPLFRQVLRSSSAALEAAERVASELKRLGCETWGK